MTNEEILGRLNHLKTNVQHMFSDVSHIVQEKLHRMKEHEVKPEDIHIENYEYESRRIDDLPLTLAKDPAPGVKYSYTENSEFARDAEKTEAVGIDSFGEEDTFDPEEASDHQTFRDRNQNSDLSERFTTHGMH